MVWPWCEFRMHVWNVLHAARWKCRTQKIAKISPYGHHRTTLSGYIFATKARIDNRKKLLNSNISPTCPYNMANFGLLVAKICWRVWGTAANFNGFRVLAAILHDSQVVGVSQTLRRWTEGTTYIRQGGITLGIGPFLVSVNFCSRSYIDIILCCLDEKGKWYHIINSALCRRHASILNATLVLWCEPTFRPLRGL